MHCLRKLLGKATKLPPKRQDLDDKNDSDASCDDLPTDSEYSSKDCLKDPFNEYMIKMLNMIRELIIFCFVFMVYTAITNDPPKVTKGPAAYPFFPKNSLVKDFYRGQIMSAIEYARTTDMSFIMFYAPWDAESQAARKEFIAAAEYLKENVVFAAVNCWQPGSECRIHYNKVYRWPVLIAYPTYGTGIQYSGPISAPHIIRFLQNLMRPIKRISSDSILDFEEVFLVAKINALPKSLEYSIYYSVALKYLEVDPLAKVSFYVKPVEHTVNEITLYRWKQLRILEFDPGDWNVDSILRWIMRSIESPSSWVVPSGAKSLLLSSHLVPGPTLILFTPKNPLQDANDYYMMLQEISQEYKNCDHWPLNFDMKSKRLKNLVEHQNLLKNCKLKDPVRKFKKNTPVTMNYAFSNCSTNLYHLSEKLEVDCNIVNMERRVPGACYTRNCVSQQSRKTGTSWQQNFDPKSVQNLRKIIQNEKCRKFLAAQKIQPAIFEAKPEQISEDVDVSSLGCSNQTLDFIAMDSLLHHSFAERLGIDLFKSRDKSAVVIVNEKMETHYILTEPITSQNVRKFIRKFTNNTLSRSFNSSVDVAMKNSPSYSFKESGFTSKPFIYVEELNSNNFLERVMKNNQAVVVMYYSKQCSYCNGISYSFLTLARKLSFVDNLQFTRIDGDTNILPWEYTMEEFPTILLFPSNRKEETRVFPSELPITVPNLLGFILANLEPPLKLHLMYSICLQTQNELDKLVCLSTVRNETMTLIETTLKNWRKSNNRQRQLLLHNLAQLRQLQFLFNHTPHEFKLIDSYIKKLNTKLTEDYSVNSSKSAKDEL